MSDMNEFLRKLLTPAPELSPMKSPMDARTPVAEPQASQDDEYGYDPADDMPAEEDTTQPLKKGAPLASQADIAKIQSIPLPEAQKSTRVPAEVPQAAPSPVDDQIGKADKMQSLLQQLQEQRSQRQGNLNMLRGSNQIAQAFAQGSGGRITDGSEAVNALEKQLDQPTKDYQALIADEENQPNSDISKFMRQQAYAVLKKMAPETDYTGKLENMSAAQLQKLPGMKNIGQQQRADWIATDRVTKTGAPVKFNKLTGTYVNGLTGETIGDGESLVRDIARRDALTGAYGYVDRNNGMTVVPTNYGNSTLKPKTTNDETGEVQAPKDLDFGEFARKAPEVAKEFRGLQKEYNADMKEARDTATSVTNLTSKLSSGDTKDIDSGMLGSIQTQAAKMAGQKGVLTDQDLVKFGGAGGWVAASERAINSAATGTMTDKDIAFFKRFNQLMSHSLQKDIENRTQLYASQGRGMVSSIAPDITEENVGKWLGASRVAPIVQGKSTSKDENTVTIKGPSGETATMTKENAQKYLKKPGYSLVK